MQFMRGVSIVFSKRGLRLWPGGGVREPRLAVDLDIGEPHEKRLAIGPLVAAVPVVAHGASLCLGMNI